MLQGQESPADRRESRLAAFGSPHIASSSGSSVILGKVPLSSNLQPASSERKVVSIGGKRIISACTQRKRFVVGCTHTYIHTCNIHALVYLAGGSVCLLGRNGGECICARMSHVGVDGSLRRVARSSVLRGDMRSVPSSWDAGKTCHTQDCACHTSIHGNGLSRTLLHLETRSRRAQIPTAT